MVSFSASCGLPARSGGNGSCFCSSVGWPSGRLFFFWSEDGGWRRACANTEMVLTAANKNATATTMTNSRRRRAMLFMMTILPGFEAGRFSASRTELYGARASVVKLSGFPACHSDARWVREVAELWSAPAERSGDGALITASLAQSGESKAVSRYACHRTPNLPRVTADGFGLDDHVVVS